MSQADLGELQSILVGAMRCADCRDPRCVNLCPEHVDVRAAMRLIIARANSTPSPSWTQEAEQADSSAKDGIGISYEWH